jgi:hypothetical protein
MELKPLVLADKPFIKEYLEKAPHFLAAYSFENIFSWKPLFEVFRAVVCGRLCLFFKNEAGIFMPLPPLGGFDANVVHESFALMESINHNRELSRIENIEAQELDCFKKNDFRVYEKNKEYIVRRNDIVEYKGDRFKDKRNLCNFFKKNYIFSFKDYESKDEAGVLALYKAWKAGRAEKNGDVIFKAMLDDSERALKQALDNFGSLDMRAKIIECKGEVRGFTCGFPISPALFCVSFEFGDLGYRGLAQFMFSEFAGSLDTFAEINMMDDSGIENIRATKLSFRPARTPSSYTALSQT